LSNSPAIERKPTLVDRIIALWPYIRLETGRRLDAMAAPDAVADRVLRAADEKDRECLASLTKSMEVDVRHIQEIQVILNNLKQLAKSSNGQKRVRLRSTMLARKTTVTKLKEDIRIKKQDILSLKKGDCPQLINDRNTAKMEAEAMRTESSRRFLYVAYEMMQEYEDHEGFENMHGEPRRNLIDLILLIAALTVDPDAGGQTPHLSKWQEIPWEHRQYKKRVDNLIWDNDGATVTRHQLRDSLFNNRSVRWLRIVRKAVKAMERLIDATPKNNSGAKQKTTVPKQSVVAKPLVKVRSNKVLGAPRRYSLECTIEIVNRYNKWQTENPEKKQALFDGPQEFGVNGLRRALSRLRELRRRFENSKLSIDDFERKHSLTAGSMQQVLDLRRQSPKGVGRRK